MTGGTPSTLQKQYYDGGTIRWLVSGDIHKGEIYDCNGRITRKGVQNSAAKSLPINSVLIALNGQGKTRGTVALLRRDDTTCNQSIVAISPNNSTELDYYYLFVTLRSMYQKIRDITGDKKRSGLSIRILKELQIPLPPLEEQKRIAGILDKAEGLRRKRARAITLTNTLLRSVFLDMFGDPVTNPMGWEVGTIRDLLKEAKYGTSQKANVEKLGIPVLRMGNITYQGEIDLSDLKHVEMSGKDLQKYTTQKDDILFNRTNSKELVGKTAIVTFNDPVAFAGYLVRGRVNRRADSYYISAYLNSVHGKTTLQSMCKSIVGMANINAQELQNIKIQIPPIELQKSFRLKVETVLAQRETFKTSLERINTLTAALTQRAFKGELTEEDANG